MKFFGMHLSNKKYLLPLVLMAAVLFISQGIAVPDYSNPREAKLSKPQKAKPSPCAVAKPKTNAPQTGVAKAVQFFDLCSNVASFNKPTAHISAFHHESRTAISLFDSVIPARAPPA